MRVECGFPKPHRLKVFFFYIKFVTDIDKRKEKKTIEI